MNKTSSTGEEDCEEKYPRRLYSFIMDILDYDENEYLDAEDDDDYEDDDYDEDDE